MFPVLHSERLVLRELSSEDHEEVFGIFSNPDVTRYYGQDPFTRLEEADRLLQFFASAWTGERGIRWGIQRKSSPGLIGTIGFNAWSPKHKRAELGYELHPDYWGAGYASEAAAEVIRYGWESMDLVRIGAIVYVENTPSASLLRKLGFREEGILRNYMYQNGASHDTRVFSLTADPAL
ncbi:GNAT family N-acetyltransferase [Paenibacillus sp. JX-17]|uniref:GNAT family N-acetyltransferase n=1 Tax=Paenibacillus lacisoli TaxID=3064525 RepID=A0ABT9C6Z4_9BACL|nr:GNAT family N-acetyltransferase [Paenibacillus sp. JX-17]MDO7905044.1 GNAT family N-acetyltransferase [Paenibacillus sp. JX-17]